MTHIVDFKKRFPSVETLEEKFKKIDKRDISNVKKLEMKQRLKEANRFKMPKFFKHQINFFDDEDDFERRVEIGRWD